MSSRHGLHAPGAPPLRVLIVDDEVLARSRLGQLVRDVASAGGVPALLVGEFETADAALHWLHQHRADVVLLDIQMPGMGGIALATHLRTNVSAPAVVFVTAHAEHALHAFELDAIDYLTKPVRRDRLHAALLRVARRARPAADAAELPPALVISERGRLLRVPLAEVLYLRAESKYVTVRTALRSHVLDGALSDIAQRLGDGFLRVHRNAIVATSAVRRLERRDAAGDGHDGWAVLVHPTGEWLTVSRRQLQAVRDAVSSSGL